MKKSIKTLPILLIALLTIMSCSKTSNDIPPTKEEEKLYNVSFKVKSFKQTIVPIAGNTPLNGTNEVDSTIYKIQYLIYDNKGKNISNFVQFKGDEKFGSLSIRLPEGDFKIIAWASSEDVSDATSGNYDYIHANLPAYTTDNNEFIIADCFFATIDFSVSESSYVNDLNLERKTAKIELNLEGELPENTATLVLLYDSPVSFAGHNGEFLGLGEYRIQRTYENLEDYKIEGGYSFTALALPEFDNNPYIFDLTITCQDEESNILYHEVIEGVGVLRNKMTKLTGSIVENDADNSEFTVNINTDWDDVHDEVNF